MHRRVHARCPVSFIGGPDEPCVGLRHPEERQQKDRDDGHCNRVGPTGLKPCDGEDDAIDHGEQSDGRQSCSRPFGAFAELQRECQLQKYHDQLQDHRREVGDDDAPAEFAEQSHHSRSNEDQRADENTQQDRDDGEAPGDDGAGTAQESDPVADFGVHGHVGGLEDLGESAAQ